MYLHVSDDQENVMLLFFRSHWMVLVTSKVMVVITNEITCGLMKDNTTDILGRWGTENIKEAYCINICRLYIFH